MLKKINQNTNKKIKQRYKKPPNPPKSPYKMPIEEDYVFFANIYFIKTVLFYLVVA